MEAEKRQQYSDLIGHLKKFDLDEQTGGKTKQQLPKFKRLKDLGIVNNKLTTPKGQKHISFAKTQ